MPQRLIPIPLMTLLLTACVTINIYFPAAAAEEAARTIVREALGGEAPAEQKEQAPVEGGKSSQSLPAPAGVQVLLGQVMEWLVPPAHAASQADININTPAISRLRSSMARRSSALAPYFRSGAIGFDRNGLVAVKDLNAVALRERGQLRRLVAEENSDRDALYREIARANGHPEWEQDIRQTFARVWVEEAYPGYWYQDARGNWQKK